MSLPIRALTDLRFHSQSSLADLIVGSGNYHLSLKPLNWLTNDNCLLLCGLLCGLKKTSPNQRLWITFSRKHDSEINKLEVIISIQQLSVADFKVLCQHV